MSIFHVTVQVSSEGENFVTNGTIEGGSRHICRVVILYHVPFQTSLASELFFAKVTLYLDLFVDSLDVLVQIGFRHQLLGAKLALESDVAVVDLNVTLQARFRIELFITNITLIRQVFGFFVNTCNVLQQNRTIGISSIAQIAFKSFLLLVQSRDMSL